MAIDSLSSLVEALSQHRLLEAGQLEEVKELQARFPDPRALARELMQRGWLTPYQVNQLFQDRGSDLVLGQYVLLERLGEGGMGQVFKARHQGLDRVVALKLIRKEQLANPEAVRRFHREIQAVAALNHPNIVIAFDADQANGTHFFVMEYVEGKDLGRIVKQSGPLPVNQACEVIRQAALGLQHAFERGMVHRDIKPSNLLLTAKGFVVKILDMGLARIQQTLDGDALSSVTQVGTVVGTPDFIAPEQARNAHKADIRADIYSLGCTFYFLLTGRPPFPAETATEKLYKHWMEEATPVQQLRPEVPPAVAAVVRRLMAKRPEDRYQTPQQVADALAAATDPNAPPVAIPLGDAPRPLATDVTVPMLAVPIIAQANHDTAEEWRIAASPQATPPSLTVRPMPDVRRGRPWGWMGAAVALLAVIGLGLLLLRPTGRPPGPTSAGETIQTGLPALIARADNPLTDWDRLRRDILEFCVQHPGTPEARQAAGLFARLPSPLNRLDPRKLSGLETFKGQPEELVGILGEHRLRHWGQVHCVAISPDSQEIASGADNGFIRFWNPATGEMTGEIEGPGGHALALAYSPDGKLLAVGNADGIVRLWDLENREQGPQLEGHKDAVSGLAFSPDGRTLASASRDRTVKLWDLGTGKARATLQGHSNVVFSVAFTPDGKLLASGSRDQTVKLWDPETGKEMGSLDEAGASALAVAFSPTGGRTLAVARSDGLVRLWNLATEKSRSLRVGQSPVYALAFSPDGTTLATGGLDSQLRVWTVATGKAGPTLLQGPGHQVTSLAFSADGKTLVAGSWDSVVRLWDAESYKPRFPPRGLTGPVLALAFSPDGTGLALGCWDDAVRLIDLNSNWRERVLRGHRAPIHGLAYAPDGRKLASASTDVTVRIWDAAGGTELATCSGHDGGVNSVAWSADGKLLASGGGQPDKFGEVKLWESSQGRPREPLLKHRNYVSAVGFSPDGKLLASGSFDRTVKLWEIPSGKDKLTLAQDEEQGVAALAWSPDGRMLAVASEYETVRLWDPAEGKPKGTLGEHEGAITGLAYSPDSKLLAVTTSLGHFVCWRLSDSSRLIEWRRAPGAIQSVAFAPDNRHLALGNSNGTVYFLRLPRR